MSQNNQKSSAPPVPPPSRNIEIKNLMFLETKKEPPIGFKDFSKLFFV
jgi:hypothetical protein